MQGETRQTSRRNHRWSNPRLEIRLQNSGSVFTSRDWSLGGIGLVGEDDCLMVGTPVLGYLRMAGSEEPWRAFRAEVARIDRDHGIIGIVFSDLSSACFDLLGHHLRPASAA